MNDNDDICYECKGYDDDYYIDENGEFIKQNLDLESDDECLWTSVTDDCSQEDLSYPLTEVLAWMPLPKPYRANMEEKPDASADWKGHYMGRFEKVE